MRVTNKLWLLIALLTVTTGGGSVLFAQADPAGRTYKGRPIARVMSWRGWRWLLRPDRDLWEQPERVLDALRIRPGQTVADIGTGVGYFAVRLAQRVGPTGTVYAVDIQPEMIRMLKQRLDQFNIRNVVPVLSTPDDPKLPPSSVELALMVDVYHEIQNPDALMKRLAQALTPQGRLALIEYRAEDPKVPILPDHKMTLRQVRYELEELGFAIAEVHEFLPRQHLIVFRTRDGDQLDQFPHVYLSLTANPDPQAWRDKAFKPLPSTQPIALLSVGEVELDLLLALPDGGSVRLVGRRAGQIAWYAELVPPALRVCDGAGRTLRDYSAEARWIAWGKRSSTWRWTLRHSDGTVRIALDGYPLGAWPVAVPAADQLKLELHHDASLKRGWVRMGPAARPSAGAHRSWTQKNTAQGEVRATNTVGFPVHTGGGF